MNNAGNPAAAAPVTHSPADLDLQHAPVEVGPAVCAAHRVLLLAAAVLAGRAGVPHARLGVLVHRHACGSRDNLLHPPAPPLPSLQADLCQVSVS